MGQALTEPLQAPPEATGDVLEKRTRVQTGYAASLKIHLQLVSAQSSRQTTARDHPEKHQLKGELQDIGQERYI